MLSLRALKTELDLNNKHRTACIRHAGAARFAYHWALARVQAALANGEKSPTAIDLQPELNALKKTELAWRYEVSKCAPQEALRDLGKAFANFIRRVKEKKAGRNVKIGFARFKSKKRGLGGFRLTGILCVFEKAIQLARLGLLRLKERGYLAVRGVHILSATVSEKAGRWFFPSTKRCWQCGNEKAVSLAGRVYSCQPCGRVIDRDLNAAINLEQLLHC